MQRQLTPAECIELIRAHKFPVQKKYGQNFLTDENVIEGIVEFAGVCKEDTVLEIGPGMGALTGYLLRSAGKVCAVEVDRMLIPILEDQFGENENFSLVCADIMKTDIPAVTGASSDSRIKVAANLPYYITTPIVLKLLENESCIESITVMVQKEVGLRMSAGPGSKTYGSLSLAVQYYSRAQVGINVSKNSFYPRPDVDSVVVRLDVYRPDERPVQAKDSKFMFGLIRAAFGQRRKTLVNSLSSAPDLGLTKASVAAALTQMKKSESIRGEALTLSEFAQLSDILCSSK